VELPPISGDEPRPPGLLVIGEVVSVAAQVEAFRAHREDDDAGSVAAALAIPSDSDRRHGR
jgi:hypothetical protein